MGILIKGGTIVTATDCYQGDVRIEDEKVVAIGKGIGSPEDKIIQVNGCYLFPGGVDVHTHFELPVGDTVTADDFGSGTKAAIMGGTTTIVDYATQFKGETLKQALSNWHQKADEKCYTDYGFHMAITDWNDDVAKEMLWLSQQAGVSSIKLYMAYKNILQVDDDILFQALERSRECGVLVCLHCENGDMIDNLVKKFLSKGQTGPYYHHLSRPIIAEKEAVTRAIALAELADASLYVVHLTCNDALEVVADAKARGLKVYAETCPQYLLLDESRYYGKGFEIAKYAISPPLRSKDNQEKLWKGLHNGTLDVVATDHCSFNFVGQKDAITDNFSKIPNGMPGVENRLKLLYTYGVVPGKMTINEFVNRTSTQPAKIFGLFPKKGTIAPGSDGDIVVWNPRVESVISASEQYQRVDYTPFEGFNQIGNIEHVFLRGQHVVRDGKLCSSKPKGAYLLRKTF